ncbi:L-lactate dehydrogenase B chain-like isoform X2 [Scaptodrosophila lebanonensis]|uniref:L-lactate dehydrogenase n=1 Tax=Drosophila lebanonensis TaxID=7225 RepID=A0A6J2ULB6_DROLE|nr:L-lactate dehydrogenase B chain-like isoform X2 [Scaptodrosophila lebanonensis]
MPLPRFSHRALTPLTNLIVHPNSLSIKGVPTTAFVCIQLRTLSGKSKDPCAKKEEKRGGKEDNEALKSFQECLYKSNNEQKIHSGRKVSIVGTGAVGMACAIAILAKGVTNRMSFFDVNEKWCNAERMDLMHGSLLLNNAQINACSTPQVTEKSRVIVVTAGARPKKNETRLDVAQKTADIMKNIMPELVKHSPNAVFIIVSNPADVMAWVAQKVSKLPYERCFSAGCHLDSLRFRYFIAQRLKVSPRSVHGYVIGEHGGSSVPLWSTLTVGGIQLHAVLPSIGTKDDPLQWGKVHEDVVKAAFDVIAVKGYTNWAIGLSVADIVSAIFENSNRIISLSTNVQGICDIKDEVYLSLPCRVSRWGLAGIMRLKLSKWEKKMLKKSVAALVEAQNGIKL